MSYTTLPAPRLAQPPRRRLKAAPDVRFIPPPVPEGAVPNPEAWAAQEQHALQVQTDIPPTLEAEEFPHNMGYPWSPEWHGGGWTQAPDVPEYSPAFFPMSPIAYEEHEYVHHPPTVPYTPNYYVPVEEDGRSVQFPQMEEYAGFWPYEGFGLGIVRSPHSPENPGRQYWRTKPCHFWAESGGRECPHGDLCCL
jgi:hypothetical protein